MRVLIEELADIFGSIYRKDIAEVSAYLKETSPSGQLNCYQVICIFLFFVSRYSSQNVFKEMLLLLSNFLKNANPQVPDPETNLGLPLGKRPSCTSYSSESDLSDFAELARAYLLEAYHLDMAPSVSFLNQKNSVYPNMYGIEKINVIRTVTFFRLLSRWLVLYGFSTAQLLVPDCPKLTADYLRHKAEI